MAGRKARAGHDEQRGENPLTGTTGARVSGEVVPGGRTGRGYSWPPFEPGNTAAVRHGAYSRRVVLPRAQEILTAALEDPAMPDHVRSAGFAAAAQAWAEAEAVAELVLQWAVAQMENGDVGAMMTPPLPGTKAPIEVWRAVHAHAANLRAKLGLDPVSYSKIARDLGLAARAQDAAIERMGRAGAEIVARREREAGNGDAVVA